jgi:hypothetical protein
MGRVSDFLRKEPGDWFFGPVQPEDGTAAAHNTLIAPESAYVGLYLEAMRISTLRVGFQSFYGSVTSTCVLESRTGQRAELYAVSTPAALHGVDPKHLDRVVTGTIPLVRSMPYRGGGLDAEIGLFAFPGGYLLGPYLDFLGDVAVVASAFLPPAGALASAALASPVRRGLDLLFGAATDARLEVGLAHTWEPLVSGLYAAVRAPEPQGGFRVSAGRRLLNPDGSEVRAAYLVLRLDAQRQRHDWAKIPDVLAAYQVIAEAARRGDLVSARDALRSFHRIAVLSPDLLAADGRRLHDLVEGEVKRAFPGGQTGGWVETRGGLAVGHLPDLKDIPLYTA